MSPATPSAIKKALHRTITEIQAAANAEDKSSALDKSLPENSRMKPKANYFSRITSTPVQSAGAPSAMYFADKVR